MVEFSTFRHIPKLFSVPCERTRSADYKVYVNGQEAAVYTCRISAYPFNTVWPGHQRPVNQTENASFVNLVSDEAFEIEVEPLKKSVSGRVMIKPYSKDVKAERVGNRIRFTLNQSGGYVFQIDDYHGLLYLFNNKPVPCEDPASVTYYFGKGVHFPGKITLKSNESVYVDKDALVYGWLYGENVENIRIYGNGIFDDSGEERFTEDCYDAYVNGNAKFYDCKNIRMEGVGFTNSVIWCVNLFHCFDVTMDGINVFGQWRYNTDGVDLVNCQRITLRNSFIHSFDDTVTVKGLDRYAFESCRDILVEGCTLWCDWGKTCELGLETTARDFSRITFRDCDVLRGGNTVCDIQNGDCAEVHDILFENIRTELEFGYTPEVMQRTEEQEYTAKDTLAVARILSISNKRFRTYYAHLGISEAESELPPEDPRYAGVHDVTVKDISIFCDPRIVEAMGTECVSVLMQKVHPTSEYKNIRVENVVLNGKRLSPKDLKYCFDKCEEDCLTVI